VKVDILKENTASIFSVACCLLHAGFLLGLFFSPEDGGNIFLGNLTDFHWTTQHYIPEEFFISTAMRTSNPT
jgi:hypothetical protein